MNNLELNMTELDAFIESERDDETSKVKKRFADTEKLYHFTGLCKAWQIIESGNIRYGKLQNVNDINEAYRAVCADCSAGAEWESIRLAEDEIRRYGQISLSQDTIVNRKKMKHQMAFTIDAMWGHYGERGHGACLVFDKSSLMETIGSTATADKVRYSEKFNNDVLIKSRTEEEIQTELYKKRKQYFFTKATSWKYEQEFRILKRMADESSDEYLPIENSLFAVIMYLSDASNSDSSETFRKFLSEKGIPLLLYCSCCGEKLLTYNGHEIFNQEA